MSEQNKALVRRFVEAVQNAHDLGPLEELFSPQYVDHSGMLSPELSVGLEGVKQFFTGMFAAFPDAHVLVHDQVAEGDKVVTRKTFNGTHKGDFMGIPATNKRVEFGIIDIMRVSNGRIAEHWAVADLMSMMQQIGVIPSPGQS